MEKISGNLIHHYFSHVGNTEYPDNIDATIDTVEQDFPVEYVQAKSVVW